MNSTIANIHNRKKSSFRQQNTNDDLEILIVGIGGLGVVNLAQKLRNLITERYSYVHTIEQRGIAQRRSSTLATIRAANHYIAPSLSNARANSLIALESLEALRYVHLLEAQANCLISDFCVEPVSSEKNYPCYTGEIKDIIEKAGASCQILPVADWLKKEQMLAVHVSVAMLGAFCASLNIERQALETFIQKNLKDNKNKKAFQWGFEQNTNGIKNNVINIQESHFL